MAKFREETSVSLSKQDFDASKVAEYVNENVGRIADLYQVLYDCHKLEHDHWFSRDGIYWGKFWRTEVRLYEETPIDESTGPDLLMQRMNTLASEFDRIGLDTDSWYFREDPLDGFYIIVNPFIDVELDVFYATTGWASDSAKAEIRERIGDKGPTDILKYELAISPNVAGVEVQTIEEVVGLLTVGRWW